MKRLDFWVGLVLATAMVIASWRGWLRYEMTETLGFVTGAACVYLVVIQNIWNFPIGIANNIFLLVLFGAVRLDGNAGLQIIYLFLGLHGWYSWLYGGENRTALRVERASQRTFVVLGALVVAGTLGLTFAVRHAGGAAPALDSFTTVLSLAAQYLLNRKAVENWYLWITVDIVSIYLFIAQGLHLTAVLYFVFLCLCVVGLRSWLRSLKEQDGGESERVGLSAGGGAAQALNSVGGDGR
ncbi:MAG: nicotinamide mononucleotide transporter [Rubrivivax sp.]|nr:nicotinamide mononucleotide transporter [Pyrinomonadaceae bacterium]